MLGNCGGFMERCLFWGSAVLLRGSVVNFEGKLRISGGGIAALGEVEARLYWASDVVLRGSVVIFAGKWWKYSGFREKWSYSGEVLSLLRGGVVVSGDVGRCVPPYSCSPAHCHDSA